VEPFLRDMRETEGLECRGNQRERGQRRREKAVRRMTGRRGRGEFIDAKRRRETKMREKG